MPKNSTGSSTLPTYDLMRAAGVWGIESPALTIFLPERRALFSPSVLPQPESCKPNGLLAGRVTPTDCATSPPPPPTIFSEQSNQFGSGAIFGGNFPTYSQLNGYYGGGGLGGICMGPRYTTPRINFGQCAGEDIVAAATAIQAIASNIQNAQNAATIYGPNLVKAATWLGSGLITFSEFVTAFLAFCGPAELLALLAAAGLTIGAIVLAAKCASGA